MKKCIKVSCAVILALALLCFTSENYLRYQGYTICRDYDLSQRVAEELRPLYYLCGWAPEPGSKQSTEDPQAQENVWENGQRVSRADKDRKAQKKVMVLGCSTTFGYGVNDDQTYVWQLNQIFPNYAFDNYGVPGYSTYQCLLLMEHVLNLHKYDMVLYAPIKEHSRRNVDYELMRSPGSGEFGLVRPLAKMGKDGLVYYPVSRNRWPGQNEFVTVNFLKHLYFVWQQKPQNLQATELQNENQAKVFCALTDEMYKVAKEHNTNFAVVSLDKNLLNPQMDAIITKMEQNKPYDYVDVSFPELLQANYHVKNNLMLHHNGTANRIWAEKIAAYLRTKGF